VPTRRELLIGAGASLALAALWPGVANATITPYNGFTKRYKVLEILQVGGLSHTETIWMQNQNATNHWHKNRNINYQPHLSADTYQMAGAWSPRQVAGNVYMSHVHKPLGNTGLWNRLRLVSLAHGFDPHDPARVLSLTGQSIGRPSRVGLGAAIQAFQLATVGNGPASWSYVLDTSPGGLSAEAAAYGPLGSEARPLVMPVFPPSTGFVARLNRTSHAPGDALLASYGQSYEDRLTWGGQNPALARSAAYQGWDAARARLPIAGNVQGNVSGPGRPGLVPTAPTNLPNCTDFEKSRTRQAILAAADLLNHGGAHHVCVLDFGASQFYDTHDVGGLINHATIHNLNVYAIFAALREALDNGTLILDDVLIHIHTDFGRTVDNLGSNHWIHGYANTLIGGPIANGIPKVKGSLAVSGPTDPTGGTAQRPGGGPPLNPSDLRAVTMLAAGIDPFTSTPPLIPLSELSAYAINPSITAQAAISELVALFT
jgi:hypothetical protein